MAAQRLTLFGVAMATTNVFTVILGSRKIKWDATWNLLAWFFDPKEGHGLGNSIITRLAQYAFAIDTGPCEAQVEHNLGNGTDGKSKWPDLSLSFPTKANPTALIVLDDVDVRSPGSMRKLENLREYGSLAQKLHPSAMVRVIAITNAIRPGSLKRVRSTVSNYLGPEDEELAAGIRWRLLSMATIAEWVRAAVFSQDLPNKTQALLLEFVQWSSTLEKASDA